MQGNFTHSSWEDTFSFCLDSVKKKYPHFSENQLAQKMNIPRSTLNRQKNHPRKPRLDTYIKIIMGSGNGHLLEDGLKLFDESLARCVQPVLQVSLTEKNKEFSSFDMETLFENRDVFVVYLLASQSVGTTKDQVLNVLGNPGLEALKILQYKNLIEESNKVFHICKNETLIRSFTGIKYHLDTYSRFYKTEHVGKELNYAHSISDGLNRDAIKKLQQLHKEFHNNVKELSRKEESQGDIPYFSVAFCDSFISDSDETKGDLQ